MMELFRILALLIAFLVFMANPVRAQDATPQPIPAEITPTITPVEIAPLPSSRLLTGFRYEPQSWNNCGPATLTTALSFYGYADNQNRAANWLKPNREDKNVSPWQMAEFVNTQVPELPVYAKLRVGGTLDRLKQLIAAGYPVVIEAGYDPEPDRLGWMGHYLLVIGYDDSTQQFVTNDSYLGEGTRYSYAHVQEFWRHFNYTYIVVYESGDEPGLLTLLGEDADPQANFINALELSTAEATADRNSPYAWFNMGTNFVSLELYDRAEIAYDQARKLGLPWRMLWYQFGPMQAYQERGRYDDVLALTSANLNDGGGQYVEETYYYAALARQSQGDTERAINNLREVVNFNPNFTPARELLDELTAP